MEAIIDEKRLKELLKTAVAEVFEERRDLITEAVHEAMEDLAMARAIQEGKTTPLVPRDQIFKLLGEKE